MQITCMSAIMAGQVQFILRRHGITVISQRGPSVGDPTVTIVVSQFGSSDHDSRIRQDISGIVGATISEQPLHIAP
jgi:hypothetical protein